MAKRWRNPDKRMAEAVELRHRGWSLRRIGVELAVTEGTIRRDLARWEREQREQFDELTASLRSDITPQLRSDITQQITHPQEDDA